MRLATLELKVAFGRAVCVRELVGTTIAKSRLVEEYRWTIEVFWTDRGRMVARVTRFGCDTAGNDIPRRSYAQGVNEVQLITLCSRYGVEVTIPCLQPQEGSAVPDEVATILCTPMATWVDADKELVTAYFFSP